MSKPVLTLFMVAMFIIGLLGCAGGGSESEAMAVRQLIGKSYGAQYFDQIEQVQYTYNVKKGGQHNRRFWIWEPKTDRVTFDGLDYTDPVTYFRKDLQANSSNLLKSIDAWFINDNYWFLFPFHVARDTRTKIEDVGLRKLPMGEEEAFCVVVTYPVEGGGDTPGDVYELYLNEKVRLVQWVYRREGSKTPTRIATWDDHRNLGPLVVSMNHQGEEGNFRVWFTQVGVKLAGVDGWLFMD
jgi:hypothetical protein